MTTAFMTACTKKNLPGIPEENMTFCGSTVNGKRFDHDVDAYGKCRICGKIRSGILL